MEYREEDFLMLSGIQHFKFCRRRWALIHVESQWAENIYTVEGELLHERAHDPTFNESRGNKIIARAMRVFSAKLGISGECDVVEFNRVPQGESEGITLNGKTGLWYPYPIEYKRGKPKAETEDKLQLCCQAMCLEEMLCCPIPEGAMYYGEIRRRMPVAFTPELRAEVIELVLQMHELRIKGHTPKVKPTKACNACSIKDLCLPKLMNRRSASQYIADSIEEMT